MEEPQLSYNEMRDRVLAAADEVIGDELPVDFNVRYNQTDSRILAYIDRMSVDHPELEHWKLWISHLNSTTFLEEHDYLWWRNEVELQYSINVAFIAKRDVKVLFFLSSLRNYILFRLADAYQGHRAKLITEKASKIAYQGIYPAPEKKRRFLF